MKFLKSFCLLAFAVSNISAKVIKVQKCIVKPGKTNPPKEEPVNEKPIKDISAVQSLEDGKYTITLGDVVMTVDASFGGKIISYKLGEAEVLNQVGENPNYTGSTFWTSPQNDWGWPPVEEYDSKPFEAEIVDNSLLLNGQTSKFGYSIHKNITADANANAIVVNYSIVNESDEERKVAPWETTRIPNDGVLFFQTDKVEPANDMEGLPFQFVNDAAWFVMDEYENFRKINADGNGWSAYSAKGLLFVKKFNDLKPEEPAPGEAEIQIYAHMGKTYVELEEQGAYSTLQPGESLSYNVRWYLTHTDLEPVPSKALLKQAKKLFE